MIARPDLKSSPRQAQGHTTHATGTVSEVNGNLAVVRLTNGQEVRVRADLSWGKGGAPLPGELWVLDQRMYGQWMFAVCIGYQQPVPLKYTQTIGNGSSTTFVITHNLGSTDVLVQVFNPLTGAALSPTINRSSASTVTLTFSPAPAAGAARVVVLG